MRSVQHPGTQASICDRRGWKFWLCHMLTGYLVGMPAMLCWMFGLLPHEDLVKALVAATAAGMIGAYFATQVVRQFFVLIAGNSFGCLVMLWGITGIGWDGFPVTLICELAYSMMDRQSYELALEAINEGSISPAHVRAWREFEFFMGVGRFCLLILILTWGRVLYSVFDAERKHGRWNLGGAEADRR